MERKSSKEFWWKAKSASYDFAFEDFIFVVGSAANSVGTTLEFAAFCSGPDAKNIAEVAPSGFFCPQPWFLRRSEHIFLEKHQHFDVDRHPVMGKEILGKLITSTDVSILGQVGSCRPATSANGVLISAGT